MNDRQERAAEPEDLARLFVERANAGDADGLAALYEPDAVLAFARSGDRRPRRHPRHLRAADRKGVPVELEEALPTIRQGDLALTATDATARESVSRSRDDSGRKLAARHRSARAAPAPAVNGSQLRQL